MTYRALLATFAILVPGAAWAQSSIPTSGGTAATSSLTPNRPQAPPIKKYYEALRKQVSRTAAKTKGPASAPRGAEKGGAVGTTRDLIWAEDYSDWKARQKSKVRPKKIQGGISDVHVVQPGDTLWSLSSRYVNSPWLWPRVWSYNPQVTNPHWIYPGQVIRFTPRRKAAPEKTPLPRIKPVVRQIEPAQHGLKVFRHTAFVSKRLLARLGRLENSQKGALLLSRFDEAYARFKQATSIKVGDRFLVARVGRRVKHPVSGKEIGYIVHINGEVTVTTAGSNRRFFTIRVGQTWRSIERGNVLLPWENIRARLQRRTNTANARGYIIASLGSNILGQYQMAFVDLGSRHGVKVGNLLTVVRRVDAALRLERYKKKLKYFPIEEVAQIFVVSVKRNTCTGILRRGSSEAEVGDKVMMRQGE